MPIRKEKLKMAISTIQKTEDYDNYKYFSSNMFLKVQSYISNNIAIGEQFPRVVSFMKYISHDVYNIETITTRLDWERELWKDSKLDGGKWEQYAQCDIDLFHIELRSIFDYVAKIIKRVSDHPDQVPDEGFNALKTWLDKSEENKDKLGKDLAELVYNVNWFDDLKNVRDVNVHQGGTTLVFLDKDRILFQTHKGDKNLIYIPEVMYNENVVEFELYAGMYFGYLIAFLEEFATVLTKHLPQGKRSFGVGKPRYLYPEMPVIYTWIERLLSIVNEQQ